MITQILKLLKEKSFTGDDDAETVLAAMKGLSIYLMAPLIEEEVVEDVDYAKSVTNASSITAREIRNLSKRKASVPSSFANMLIIIKKIGNLLNALFGMIYPLLIHFHKYVITPLGKFSINARNKFSASSRAAVMWKIYQEINNFCRGKMAPEATGNDALIPEL